MQSIAPRYSVIVCTRNRASMLDGCLESLLADVADNAEVIVVDNGSTDSTRDVVLSHRSRTGRTIHFLTEPHPGQSWARNTGVARASSELLLFTDDDVLIERGWSAALVAALESPGVGAVGGRVLPAWPAPPPGWLLGDHASYITLSDNGEAAFDFLPEIDGRLPVGANMAIRRSALTGIDPPFNTRLGHQGTVGMGGDENVLLRTIAESYRLSYAPKARVHHRIVLERTTWRGMRRLYFHHGFGWAREEYFLGRPPLGPRRRLRRLVKAVARLASVRLAYAGKGESEARARAECDAYLELGRSIEHALTPRFAVSNVVARALTRLVT